MATGALFIGLIIPYREKNGLILSGITVLVALGVGFAAYLNWPKTIISILLFLSIATTSLGVYEIPLIAGQNLQLMRAILLVAGLLSLPLLLNHQLRVSRSAVIAMLITIYAGTSALLLTKNSPVALSLVIGLAFGCLYLLFLPNAVRVSGTFQIVTYGLYGAALLLILFTVYQFIAWFSGVGFESYRFTIPFASQLQMDPTTVVTSRTGPFFRITLPHSSSSFVAPNIAAILLILIALQTHRTTSPTQSKLTPLSILLLTVMLVMTYSRGAWVGFVVGLLIILRYRMFKISNKTIILALIGVATGLVVLAVAFPELLISILNRFNPESTQLSDRYHWQFLVLAIQIFADNPILGVGIGNYEHLTSILHAHNVYATALAEGGIIYLSLIVLWCLTVLREAHSTIDSIDTRAWTHALVTGLLAAFASVLVNNLFQQSWYAGFFWMIAGLIAAANFVVKDQVLKNA